MSFLHAGTLCMTVMVICDQCSPKSPVMARHMNVFEFRSRCLRVIDEVARTGTPVVITQDGRPVADLVPHRQRPRSLRGLLKGELFITGDITGPIDVEWDALQSTPEPKLPKKQAAQKDVTPGPWVRG